MVAATSTVSGSSYMYSRRMVSHVRTYNWPPLQLNLWIVVMLLASASIMGVFGNFIVIQDRLQLPVPWYVPTVSLACFQGLRIVTSFRHVVEEGTLRFRVVYS